MLRLPSLLRAVPHAMQGSVPAELAPVASAVKTYTSAVSNQAHDGTAAGEGFKRFQLQQARNIHNDSRNGNRHFNRLARTGAPGNGPAAAVAWRKSLSDAAAPASDGDACEILLHDSPDFHALHAVAHQDLRDLANDPKLRGKLNILLTSRRYERAAASKKIMLQEFLRLHHPLTKGLMSSISMSPEFRSHLSEEERFCMPWLVQRDWMTYKALGCLVRSEEYAKADAGGRANELRDFLFLMRMDGGNSEVNVNPPIHPALSIAYDPAQARIERDHQFQPAKLFADGTIVAPVIRDAKRHLVKIGGHDISIIEPAAKSDGDPPRMTVEQLIDILARRVPPELVARIDLISIDPRPSPRPAGQRGRMEANWNQWGLHIYPGADLDKLPNTLTHELGHTISLPVARLKANDIPVFHRWDKARKADGAIPPRYAAMNSYEDFAETVAHHFAQNENTAAGKLMRVVTNECMPCRS